MLSAEFEVRKTRSTNRITLRLPNNVLEKLKKESERKDIPLNAVITKILSKNTTYDMEFNTISTITMSHVLFSKIMDSVDDIALGEIAAESPDIIKKLFTIMGVEYKLDNVIEKYFVIFSKYCGWFKFTYDTSGQNYRFVFETPLGEKWTKFLSLYVKNVLDSLKIHVDNESTHDNVILFEFRNR
ncbi:MAG: hypothetical protein HY223_01300 [Thaumarchaeota archaeon]|nr:hypothetical protein [Nitrososphaerota archaeon]